MQVVKCNKRHVRIPAPLSSTSQLFRLPLRLRNHESAFVSIRDDLINLRLNLVQVAFQRLCILELAVSFSFLDEGLQKGFLLEQGLNGMREFRIWIDDGAIDRFSWRRC
jgi:hypothetical protein